LTMVLAIRRLVARPYPVGRSTFRRANTRRWLMCQADSLVQYLWRAEDLRHLERAQPARGDHRCAARDVVRRRGGRCDRLVEWSSRTRATPLACDFRRLFQP